MDREEPVNPEETKMEEKELKTVDNKADGDSGKLDKIETLLREQQEHNRKMLRSSHTFLWSCLRLDYLR